jgi:hypothetical protein
MDSLRIDSGLKRIAINDDAERIIEFDPTDVLFAERFYGLIQEFETKQVEYEQHAAEIDADQSIDKNGLPANLVERLAFMREVCEFMRSKIDELFGASASQNAFGDSLSLEMIEQFFTGITPFIQQARSDKIAKYTPARKNRRVMR